MNRWIELCQDVNKGAGSLYFSRCFISMTVIILVGGKSSSSSINSSTPNHRRILDEFLEKWVLSSTFYYSPPNVYEKKKNLTHYVSHEKKKQRCIVDSDVRDSSLVKFLLSVVSHFRSLVGRCMIWMSWISGWDVGEKWGLEIRACACFWRFCRLSSLLCPCHLTLLANNTLVTSTTRPCVLSTLYHHYCSSFNCSATSPPPFPDPSFFFHFSFFFRSSSFSRSSILRRLSINT